MDRKDLIVVLGLGIAAGLTVLAFIFLVIGIVVGLTS